MVIKVFQLTLKQKMPHRSVALINSMMAFEEGFEPPTDGLEGRCSILLSYSNNYISIDYYNKINAECKVQIRIYMHFLHINLNVMILSKTTNWLVKPFILK